MWMVFCQHKYVSNGVIWTLDALSGMVVVSHQVNTTRYKILHPVIIFEIFTANNFHFINNHNKTENRWARNNNFGIFRSIIFFFPRKRFN